MRKMSNFKCQIIWLNTDSSLQTNNSKWLDSSCGCDSTKSRLDLTKF